MAAQLRIQPESDADRRGAQRVALGRTGTLRVGTDAPFEVEISDLTRDGCRIHTSAVLSPHAEVQVGLAGVGLTPGQIVWSGSAGYGCRFDRPLAKGLVTAAFEPSNIAAFPADAVDEPLAKPGKIGPRAALALIAGTAVAGWGIVAAGAWLLAN